MEFYANFQGNQKIIPWNSGNSKNLSSMEFQKPSGQGGKNQGDRIIKGVECKIIEKF
jgi:hypothetical protein